MLLTPTFPPLGELVGAEVLVLDQGGRVLGGVADHRPLEAALHLAVYAARPDVGAICRLHGPAVAAFGATGADLDQALARAWCLEDRCRVALAAGDRGRPLDPEALGRRRRWYDAETARLARWLRATAR